MQVCKQISEKRHVVCWLDDGQVIKCEKYGSTKVHYLFGLMQPQTVTVSRHVHGASNQQEILFRELSIRQ